MTLCVRFVGSFGTLTDDCRPDLMGFQRILTSLFFHRNINFLRQEVALLLT